MDKDYLQGLSEAEYVEAAAKYRREFCQMNPHLPTLPPPQDCYALLVEDCRKGMVNRIEMYHDAEGKPHTDHIPHDAQDDVSDLPVFYLGEMPERNDAVALGAAVDSLEAGTFRLPYPRCAFMQSIPPDSISTLLAYKATGTKSFDARMYLTILEQEDSGIFMYSYVLNSGVKHWSKQVTQVVLRQGQYGTIEVAHDPNGAKQEFIDILTDSAKNRIEVLLSAVNRLMSRKAGKVVYAQGGGLQHEINKRRRKAHLPPIAPIRIIDLNAEPEDVVVQERTGAGSPKSPHYVHGHWRQLRSGRKTWIAAYATGDLRDKPLPPWYEVRT